MRFNTKKFFELAKAHGFEAADLNISKGHSMSVTLYHGEIENYSEENTTDAVARGIINGKLGGCVTEKFDKNTIEFMIDSIEKTARVIETNDPVIIYKGSKKYHRGSYYNKALFEVPFEEKKKILFEIEKKLFAYDKRINEVASVSYSESSEDSILQNSYGLKLKTKKSDFSIVAQITAKEKDEIRSNYAVFAGNNLEEFNIDKFVKELADETLKKLGSSQCKSKKYPVILNPDCAATLIRAYLSSTNAEDVQKNSSLFIGKLHQQIASKKLTVTENPLTKNVFFDYYDDEGVAINKKDIVKKGVLQTYLYTLETAAKDGVEPTGNGYRGAGKASAGLGYIIVKPGRKSEEEMMSSIKEGVYITDLEGLHAGMNARSGNFSLQSQGFMIRDGKLAEPLSLITASGNLVEMFNNIKDVGSNSKFLLGGKASCPSISFKKLFVSGQ